MYVYNLFLLIFQFQVLELESFKTFKGDKRVGSNNYKSFISIETNTKVMCIDFPTIDLSYSQALFELKL